MEKAKNSTDKTLSMKNLHTKYVQKMLKFVQILAKMTKIEHKKAKNIKNLLENQKLAHL